MKTDHLSRLLALVLCLPLLLSGCILEFIDVSPAQPAPAQVTFVPGEADLQIHFIDVGQGDATLIVSPEGQTALIDAGADNKLAQQYLEGLGLKKLNVAIATHPDFDHIGGMADLFAAIPPERVVTNGQPHTSQAYEKFLDAIEEANAEYLELVRGDTIPLGSLVLEVLSPVKVAGDDLNDNSLVLRLVYGQASFIFMGDAEKGSEREMVSAGLPVQADIIKVGHHGSRSSSTPEFLAAVQPALAVYSAGVDNKFGHPHAEAIAALQAVGAEIIGTDQYSTIVITSNGSGYQLASARGQLPMATLPASGGATPPRAPVPLSLEISSVTSPVAPGGNASLEVRTTPRAECTITVYAKSGPSKAQGLEPKTAGSDGSVVWNWRVGGSTAPGTYRIVVSAARGSETITQETTYTVQK